MTRLMIAARVIVVALVVLALPAGSAHAQDLQALFTEAEGLFLSAAQPDSISIFTTIIDTLESQGPATLPPDLRELLVRSLTYRAEASHNFGEVDAAVADLRRLLEVMPSTQLDRSLWSPKLVDLFDAARAEIVGFLELIVTPSDSLVLVDGNVVDDQTGLVALVAGPHVVGVEKLGHTAVQQEIDINGGDITPLEASLTRARAVLYVSSRPPGARVSVGGREFGVTGEDGLVIDGLDVGDHELVMELDGYRTTRGQVPVRQLTDYTLDEFVLELESGDLVLEGVPEGSSLKLDGSPISPADAGTSRARVSLSPGEYFVEVEHPLMGAFESTVTIVDARETAISVDLRPSVVFLGVLGGDEVGRETLNGAIQGVIAQSDEWSLTDRTADARDLFAAAGLDAEAFRGVDDASALPGFGTLRTSVAEQFSGSVYVFGVLADDLVARQADVWAWPRAVDRFPADRVRVPLTVGSPAETLTRGLFTADALLCPTSGVQLADTDVGGAPVVVALEPGGPGEVAGVQPGDLVVAIAGENVTAALDIARRVRVGAPGEAMALRVDRGGTAVELELVLNPGYCMIEPNRQDYLYGVAMAQIESMLARGGASVPDWLLELNKAQLFMQAGQWDDAVRVLQRVEAPDRPGLGRGTVDYMFGVALSMIDPSYLSSARDALRRADSSSGARLGRDDGLLIGPLARAYLAGLER